MKLKNIIKTLRRANEWRRWANIEMPNPATFWIAIDEAIRLLKEQSGLIDSINQTNQALLKKLKNEDEILNSAVGELQFSNIQKDHYKSILDEVDVLLKKWVKYSLIQKVIENWKTRRVLDISIHFDMKCWIDNF